MYGRVPGSKAVAISSADFAMLMRRNAKHRGQNKSKNFKESMKADARRYAKEQR